MVVRRRHAFVLADATATGLPADLPFLFSAGQRFGPYLIVRPLGKGGMGQVYEAEETESGRRVAMKILSRGLGDDEERERFLSEGRLAASLSHPNCVYVFGTSEVQGFPVIAMELAPGGTLKDLVVARHAAAGRRRPSTRSCRWSPASRRPRRSASCTATSSRRTASSIATAACWSATSACR